MDRALLRQLTEAVDSGREAVLCTVVDERGSTPRGRGAAMLVFSDGSIRGTVGGGGFEYRVMERALAMLEKGTNAEIYREEFSATEAALEGGACGGEATIFLERYGREDEVLIFGAGHVGRALARVADTIGMRVTTWDERSEFANPENIPWGRTVACPLDRIFECGVTLSPLTYVVVVTRGHQLDADVVRLLDGKEYAYIGLIGSRRKVAFVRDRLLKAGVSEAHLDRVSQPVGLPIKAETPEEIAVSIMAEIIAARRGADLRKLRETLD